MSNRILAKPAQLGVFKVCIKCRAWFALVLVEKREDEHKGSIATYRCSKCDSTFEFAEHHPHGAV